MGSGFHIGKIQGVDSILRQVAPRASWASMAHAWPPVKAGAETGASEMVLIRFPLLFPRGHALPSADHCPVIRKSSSQIVGMPETSRIYREALFRLTVAQSIRQANPEFAGRSAPINAGDPIYGAH